MRDCMNKQNDVLKIIISFIAGMSVICAASFARDLVKIHQAATRKPILKVMSLIPGGWITPWKEIYYIVYDNGDYDETEEFQLADIEI